MKALLSSLLFFSLVFSAPIHARGGGGGGHGGGGADRRGGYRDGGGNRGARGYRDHGHWNHHSNGYGRGNWDNGRWNGPYYYSGYGWFMGGMFLTGLTFYTCAELSNYHTWQIANDDIETYKSWSDQDNLTVQKIDNPNYSYSICNEKTNSCVYANPRQ